MANKTEHKTAEIVEVWTLKGGCVVVADVLLDGNRHEFPMYMSYTEDEVRQKVKEAYGID